MVLVGVDAVALIAGLDVAVHEAGLAMVVLVAVDVLAFTAYFGAVALALELLVAVLLAACILTSWL